jgi:hypothetical protein
MGYARARLWLGISGVGTAVVLASAALIWQLPAAWLPGNRQWQAADVLSLLALVGLYVILLAPFDLLGGYVLPRKHGRLDAPFGQYLKHWSMGVLIQSAIYVFVLLWILAAGRLLGVAGAGLAALTAALAFLAGQRRLTLLTTGGPCEDPRPQLRAAFERVEGWNLPTLPVTVVRHRDPGFTGGVVGLSRQESLIISRDWLDRLTTEELAIAIARRCEAVHSGSRTRGLLVALGWVAIGFFLATLLPGAGVRSAAGLVTTLMGFTLWMFLGLLVLPTLSRQASFAIDHRVLARGAGETALKGLLSKLDKMQDDEPERSALIETIFHPVPSVGRRGVSLAPPRPPLAWHAARMMLFLSWGCAGLLSRSVHCNVGRPELWVMLPTD